MKCLFEKIDKDCDPHWLVKEVFNAFCHQGHFIYAIECMIEKCGITDEHDYCWFPQMDKPNPDFHFEGIKFGNIDDEIVISEQDFVEHVMEACRQFVKLHPKHHQQVKELLESSEYFSDATLGWDFKLS